MFNKLALLCAIPFMTMTANVYAEEVPAADPNALENAMTEQVEVGYFDIKPDIVTNLAQSDSKERLHYVRLKANIMVMDSNDLPLLQEREALIKDTIISILGSKVFSDVNKPTSREEIRSECLQKISDMMYEKDGRNIVQDFLIINFLYQ
ncbi:flagellar basal body-associated FliL family protein [Anaerobiospirillum thomasii]|uniref:Flagellar protein FliL n=1 Tax=Anaerobiospirillum thomasii TaxID=179995 RepID=A0A2X0V8A0_9GAMM|nr:flagellar basal body-associated FliL family protein [Anaerobiospirillum thomasii]SPT69035.1 flagellar basal body-associated protein FliL-like protein [Anaerobiospirillum thomasii]